jgi:ubiquinol-cytochrome c reductase cytochrome b subunit
VQAMTGAALMTSYAPSDQSAWASVHYITFKQAGGWFVRGMHHYGAQAMIVLLGLHLAQVAAFGAYKKPREVTWWIGLTLLALVLAFALTGYLLPWDQKGYWATRVATNIAGTVPIVGLATQRLLQGGADYGSLTLTRFHALHVFVLPMLLSGLVVVHVALFRKHGVTAPADADTRRTEPFFPGQLARDIGAAALAIVVVIVLTARSHGAGLDAPADPSSDYPARPEWYFYALFQLLKYFHGPLEIVGTVVLPLALAAYLFVLPFLDRTRLRGRRLALGPLIVAGLAVLWLTAAALRDDAGDAKFQKARDAANDRARLAVRLAMDGVPPEGPLAMLRRSPEARGPELFGRHCASCHTLGDIGDEKKRTAPKLDHWASERWILEMLHEPDGDERFGRTAYRGEMPSMTKPPEGRESAESFKPMPAEDLEAVAAFLARGGDEPRDVLPADALRLDGARVSRGEGIVKARCTTCHLFGDEGDDADQGLAPQLAGYGSLAWITAQIANPGTKATYRESALAPERKGHMPRFDGDLSPEDIVLLARWVRARARGIAPPEQHVYP